MLKIIDFNTIQPIWQNELWTGRTSLIEPVSVINETGTIDMNILTNIPTFYGYYVHDWLVGVNSCFRTSTGAMRSRGLWVHTEFRGKGIGTKLILDMIPSAKENQITKIWTMARHSSVDFYLRMGFEKYGETNQYEFGPHSLCHLQI